MHLLGERFLLSSLTANIAGPGGTPMVLHQDEGFIPFPQPAYPLVANIAWLLDDVTDANGGTRFVPGSHLWDEPLPQRTDPSTPTVAAEGPRDVEARLSPEVRRLLGYKIWGTLGGVEGPHTAGPDGFVRRPDSPVGRLP